MELVFEKYYAPELICNQKEVSNSPTDKKAKISQKISSKVEITNDIVKVNLKYQTNNNKYIDVRVNLIGMFKLSLNEREKLDKTNQRQVAAIKSTAISILFPYLRQTVTSLTQLNGYLQPIYIPMYNIAKLLNSDTSESKD